MAEKDMAPELLERIRAEFLAQLGAARPTAQTYADAAEYAELVGNALARAFCRCLTADALPEGRLFWNLADRVVRPLLEEGGSLAAAAAMQGQQALNQQAGLGLAPQQAPLDQEALEGLLNKLAEAPQIQEVAWVLEEPVKTFVRKAVDDTLKANVEFQGKAGLRPRVVRTAESRCCKWCAALAGSYDYPHVPKDVYRRHQRCRCRVEYDPGEGRRQNVWNKTWTEEPEVRQQRIQKIENLSTNRDDSAKIEARKNLGRTLVELDNDRYVIAEAKISQFLLKPGAKHAAEFFEVGYSVQDSALLNADIYQQFDESQKTDVRMEPDGTESFSIFMKLGVTKKRTFRTVWRREPGSEKPRLITAHREEKK